MEESSKNPAENKSAAWQERVRSDADWIHNKIWNDRNYVAYLQREENTHKKELRSGIEGGALGVLIGIGLAALESLVKKEPVQFMRMASYAGGAGIGLGLLSALMAKDPKFNETARSQEYQLQHLNSIRNLLADAYGEDALKGQHQWYRWYQEIKDDPILTGDFTSGKSR